MNRYSSYGPIDDQPLVAGDNSLLGTNDWDAAENLQPGQCQSAINMDFTTQDAVTRGGFVCLPSLGSNPFSVGDNWTGYNAVGVGAIAWQAVTYANGTYVAVNTLGSASGDVAYSKDGVNWTVGSTGIARVWSAITYGNGLFVITSSDSTTTGVATSPDGATWTSRTSSTSARSLKGVTYGEGLFVAVSSDGGTSQVITSPDGENWTARASDTTNENLACIAYGGGTFVAMSDAPDHTLIYSTNGTTWSHNGQPSNVGFKSITYGNGTFVAVSDDGGGEAATSTNGVNFTLRTTISGTHYWHSVAYGNGMFIAVDRVATAAAGAVMTSPDGITWTSGTASSNRSWRAITYGENGFAALAQLGAFVTANDVMLLNQQAVFATSEYSDPDEIGSDWIMLVGYNSVAFVANGKTARTVSLGAYTVNTQSTIVQCNNLVYLFRGQDAVPLYWSGNWADEFVIVPTTTPAPGFSIIPNSSQATYYQDRTWVVDGKDEIAASDVLDFNTYDDLANNFNLNKGSSDYVVATYPFGENSLLVFKHRSILVLQNVQGSLADVTVTEVTRQVGCIGINAITTVGPDIAYMSDRNINLITLTSTNNSVQHKTLPLSRNISGILKRVNWEYAYKVSMAYFDNKLFVAVPLDNDTHCNTVLVYNFVTENWFGEWSTSLESGIRIIGWSVANYLGLQRLHAVSENGRVYVTGEGQNDICGTTVAEISTSMVSRAYNFQGNNATQRRLWADLGTNRPTFSISSSTDGASETSAILTDQTYARTESWIFNDSTYDVTNANDDFNRAYRKDYSSGPLAAGTTPGLPTTGLQCGTGFLPEQVQSYRIPIITRRQGRLSWLEITNTTGYIQIKGIGFENHAGQRSSLVQV